ncbi:MAG: xanthine dehydrogenase large subunit [Candidatus Azotimanducaceae bacterium]|jgi:xanthine dehydrogenase large subunit
MRKLPEKLKSQNANHEHVGVGSRRSHESAELHVSGEAVYVDDHAVPVGTLHAAIGKSTIAHGKILSINLEAVRSAKGVLYVITAADVPGHIDIGPVFPGDSVLIESHVEFYGQAIFAVAATTFDLAQQAVKLAKIQYEEYAPVLGVQDALKQRNFVRPSHEQKKGDAEKAIEGAPHKLVGELVIGGQEHFYLEGQVSLAWPLENGGMSILTSSQHPAEVQKLVAEVLGKQINEVDVEVRRMGGGFGGKETNAAPWACVAALLADKSRRSVKLRLSRRDDMVMTGKRHPFHNRYHVGFDDTGRILGIKLNLEGDCGFSPDLSDAIVDRAMFHSDNAYFLDQAKVIANRCKTNTVSHTAFRGFGGPQGLITIEGVMDDIARYLGKDPLSIRKINLYGINDRNITHYHQVVENNNLEAIIIQLEETAEYQKRRVAIGQYNSQHAILKKGIALTPVKFGISFTATHLNQAGALVHVYSDGSIHLNHGGTEMGQGLFTKVSQIVASEFQVDINTIKVSATRTDKVPNTSPTAASAGTDLNGKAAQNAAQKIKTRLTKFACEKYKIEESDVKFTSKGVLLGSNLITFPDLVQDAYLNRISLSATGFYKTPKIYYDRESASGQPFYYFSCGAAVSEVVIDTLTGEYKVLRTDILHDVGDSINPALDIGQIEGGFIQGMGWLTTEELIWAEDGRLITDSPATYKIPAIADLPEKFYVNLLQDSPNKESTIYRSKAVGEPPLMLAVSVWSAIRDAISSTSDYKISPQLNVPATPERVLEAVMSVGEKSNAR